MAVKRITHVIPSMGENSGGPPRSVGEICGALANLCSVRIVSGVGESDSLVPLSPAVLLELVPKGRRSLANPLGGLKFGSFLQKVVCDGSMDICHQHGLWLRVSHQTTTIARRNKIPLILSPRGMLEPWALNSKKWKKKLAWALYQRRDLQIATAFHATADSEAESIRRLGFEQPIAVIPNGVDLPEMVHRKDKTSEKRTALFLSRINPKKGLPMLLDAWKQVAPAEWRLVIAGNDDSNHLPVVKRKIRELGLGDRVEIAGALFGKAKESAYRSADLFVLPSYSENFGIVVAEALGYGVPVLTTTGCPWKELQTHNCGWWVDPTPVGIESGLASALAQRGEELREMGLKGRKLVEDHYQWPGIAERMLEFYEWVLNGGKQPDFVV